MAKKKFWFLVFWLTIISSPVISSLTPYFYKLFIDNLTTFDVDQLSRLLVVFIVFKFVETMLNTSRFFMGDVVNLDAFINTYTAVFKHIHLLDFAFHTKKSSGALISAIKRGEGAYWHIFFGIHYKVVDVVVRFIVMALFFSNISSQILIFSAVSFCLSIGAAAIFVRFNMKYRSELNAQEDKISGVVVDNMINFETVKLFSKENWEQDRLAKIFVNWKKAVWKYAYTFRGLDLGMGTIVNFSTFAILLYSLNSALTGQITLGEFVLIATFLQIFFAALYELVWGLREIAKSYTDIQKYFGLLKNEIEVKDPEKPIKLKSIKGEIAFENVTFSYEKKAKSAVGNINLQIRQGQSVALVGRSGSGKTTLTKLLLRFFDVQKGKITIDGVDITNLTKENLRSFFGVVPQEPILFNNSILYNIAYGRPDATRKEIIAAAKMANIHKFIRSLPEKYETQVGERGIKLSGGQKQRLAIARMILSDPEIIIFDEATSQLDSESEKLIQDAFWKAAAGKTTIIIAHRLSTIQKADKIVVMDKGEIIEEGSHKSLVENKESLYNHFWNLQIKLS